MGQRTFQILAQALPLAVPPLLRGVIASGSLRILNRRIQEEVIDAGKPFIGVVWHKDFLYVLDHFRRRKIVVMVSRSKDGELVARVLHRLGYRTARGSSSAGGGGALLDVIRRLQDGWGAAIIADGPKGPARRAKMGCIAAARDSGAPILTFGCHMEPAIRLRNWDRTVVPLPGSRIVVAYGEPLHVPRNADAEACEGYREEVDRRMEALEDACRTAVLDA
jgi:lysophospholipid acyltransferase (LPLAT)-like uncharacterized protein